MPLHYVKLSQEISELLMQSESVPPEVDTALGLCRQLKLPIVAEHVPHRDHALKLQRQHGVKYAQMGPLVGLEETDESGLLG